MFMLCNSWKRELTRVRKLEGRTPSLRWRTAGTDPSRTVVVVPQQTALRAHLRLELIAADHQPLEDEHRRAVADEAVALHLAEAQTSVPRATLRGLSR